MTEKKHSKAVEKSVKRHNKKEIKRYQSTRRWVVAGGSRSRHGIFA